MKTNEPDEFNKTTGTLNWSFNTHFALFYVAGAVLVWTIFGFVVKHIRKLPSAYGFVVISM